MKFELPFVGVFLIIHGRLRFVIRETIRLRRDHTWPFEHIQIHAPRSLLILGDSTAVGTGASHPDKSVAGLFAADDPTASIRVVAKNGLFLGELPALMAPLSNEHYDVVIIIIGGNDILQFTPRAAMSASLERAVRLAKIMSPQIVLINQGDLGSTPLFPRWFAPRLTKRSRAWLDDMRVMALKHDLPMVDLFHEAADDPWAQHPERYYGGDWFHPNDAGYAMWYARIKNTLSVRGWW